MNNPEMKWVLEKAREETPRAVGYNTVVIISYFGTGPEINRTMTTTLSQEKARELLNELVNLFMKYDDGTPKHEVREVE